MGIMLGGEKAYKVFDRGEIVVALHWVNKEPAMAIFPKRKRLGGAGFIIPMNIAHAYAKSNGYPTPEAIGRCVKAARVMAMEPTKDTINNILTAVLDLMPELIEMPPQPQNMVVERAVGEVKLKVAGDTVIHREVTEEVPELIIPGRLH